MVFVFSRRLVILQRSFACTMKKNKKQTFSNRSVNEEGSIHSLDNDEIHHLRKTMLEWYDENKRDLPWRNIKKDDSNQHAYAVWVSEIMLQQTQVATVIDYYNRWMKKWPTLQSLSEATLEEVREMWSGLGYYSRGQHLLEGALKVQNELGGRIPENAEQLQKKLPGVGRYTAGAIASIAFDEPTGVVDGNVIRVLSRLRRIGADSTSQVVMAAIWELANALVDPDRPGDFNQSLMELGATVCLPKNPQCASCPIRTHCRALQQVEQRKRECQSRLSGSKVKCQNGSRGTEIGDIECLAEKCSLCLVDPWDGSAGVMNYPRKPKKKPPKQQVHAVCIVERLSGKETEFLMVQRPETGLLAGMWEFPSVAVTDDTPIQKRRNKMDAYFTDNLHVTFESITARRHVDQVIHIFSHIHQTYEVESFQAKSCDIREPCDKSHDVPNYQWVSKATMKDMAVSTAMKKVFSTFNTKSKNQSKRCRPVGKEGGKVSKQRKLESFFSKK
ncbi:adenine DNA glycosylase-like [Diadema antillarum]|uniref:adenine DNA glycosylase-like n=1 Tax=Diadema antillarum TaxID=105358 RepID=UPI003A8B07FE